MNESGSSDRHNKSSSPSRGKRSFGETYTVLQNSTKSSEGKSVRPAYGGVDTLNAEFIYYSAMLKTLAPALSNDCDRQLIVPWVRKLFRPEYHSSKFREKRNKYLLLLTISLLNDETYGLFRHKPPEGALPDVDTLQHDQILIAGWETDTMWQETLKGLPKDFPNLECSVHREQSECDEDHQLDIILDQEFQLLLYIARPYAALIKRKDDRTKVATWLQTLCTIQGDYCSAMRGIRNDYMMLLLGYIHELRVVGPFQEYPPFRILPSLGEAAKSLADMRPLTDPYASACKEFMNGQPMPTEGAFCYIAITGDLIASSFDSSK